MTCVVVDSPLWEISLAPAGSSSPVMVCLPHAGAGAAVFRDWSARLCGACEILAATFRGREARVLESPLVDIRKLAASIIQDPVFRERTRDRPWSIYGHSFGALVGYELALAVGREGLPPPVLLLVAARPAPWLPLLERPIHALPEPEFFRRLGEYGGMPAELLADEEMRATVLPALRADFAAVENYQYERSEPLDLPVIALGGMNDPRAPAAALELWGRATTSDFRLRRYPGGHFFYRDSDESFFRNLREDLQAALSSVAG